MNITFHSDEYNHLKFDIKDVNLSIANGIRRILMSEKIKNYTKYLRQG